MQTEFLFLQMLKSSITITMIVVIIYITINIKDALITVTLSQ